MKRPQQKQWKMPRKIKNTSILTCLPHVRSPPPWGWRRHGISMSTSPFYTSMSFLRNETWELTEWAFIRSWVICRLRYGTSISGFYHRTTPRTSLAKIGHLLQDTVVGFANSSDNSVGDHLLYARRVILELMEVWKGTGRRHQYGCCRLGVMRRQHVC